MLRSSVPRRVVVSAVSVVMVGLIVWGLVEDRSPSGAVGSVFLLILVAATFLLTVPGIDLDLAGWRRRFPGAPQHRWADTIRVVMPGSGLVLVDERSRRRRLVGGYRGRAERARFADEVGRMATVAGVPVVEVLPREGMNWLSILGLRKPPPRSDAEQRLVDRT